MDNLEPHENHANLVLDKMAITPGLQFDHSTSIVIGRATMSPSKDSTTNELATRALVFMLAGVSTRWKQVIAYEFTVISFSPNELYDIIENIITKCHNIGILIRTVESDIGP